MSSTPNFGGHLHADAGREVVFCHSCQNEWYRDEHDLRCPSCGSEATEILENDDLQQPHGFDDFDEHGMGDHPFGMRGHSHSHAQDYHSDPEEGDIEEHVHHGPNGFFVQRRIIRQPGGDHPMPGLFDVRRGNRADPGDANAILQRFEEMLVHDFRAGGSGRSGREELFPRQHGFIQAGGSGSGPHIHRTVFTTPGGGGTASFTIATGPINARGGDGGPINFGDMFNRILGDMPPPNARGDDGPSQPGMPANFPETLHQILATVLNPANAVHGDAVFSQQALDRVITQLMEAHPQSNAAPPATQTAIDKLERKPLDSKLVGTEGQECAVCMDTMHQGDEALFLPCKHWFHEECVVTWLKEHGTCPVCRHAVDDNATPPPSNAPPPAQSAPAGPQAQPSAPRAAADEIPHRPRSRPWRTRSDNQERLNSIRDIADAPIYRQDNRRPPYTTSSSAGPRGSYGQADTSRDRNRSRSPGAERPSYASGDHDRDRYDPQPEHAGGSSGGGGSGGHGFMGLLRDWTGRGSGSEQPPREGR